MPVYNPSIELLDTGRVNYIYQPGERFSDGVAELQPSEVLTTHEYRLLPEFSRTLDLDLASSFVKKTAGNTEIPSSIDTQPAVPLAQVPEVTSAKFGTSQILSWPTPSGVTGIDGYEVYYTPDRDTTFGPAPIVARDRSGCEPSRDPERGARVLRREHHRGRRPDDVPPSRPGGLRFAPERQSETDDHDWRRERTRR